MRMGGSSLSRADFTPDGFDVSAKRIVSELFQFYSSRDVYPDDWYLTPDDFYVNMANNAKGWVIGFKKDLLRHLTKTHTTVSEKVKSVTTTFPKRRVDYLWYFIAGYVPWFSRFIQKEDNIVAYRDIVTNNHYHLIPADVHRSRNQVEFMYWDGGSSHYDGLPKEWDALKKLEEAARASGDEYTRMIRIQKALWELDAVRRG